MRPEGAPALADRDAMGAAGGGGGRVLLPPRRGIHVLATDRDVPEPPRLLARPLFPGGTLTVRPPAASRESDWEVGG